MSGAEVPGWILWMLPVLFFIHDSEEAFFLPAWVWRNRMMLTVRFPRLATRLLPHFERITIAGFAAMAAEELLILTGVTLYVVFSGDARPWLALFLAFTIHLVLHLGQGLLLRRWIPAVGTALLCLPVCVGLFVRIADGFSTAQIGICIAAGIVVAAANLGLIHTLAARSAR